MCRLPGIQGDSQGNLFLKYSVVVKGGIYGILCTVAWGSSFLAGLLPRAAQSATAKGMTKNYCRRAGCGKVMMLKSLVCDTLYDFI
jgi:hypothetical protein